MTGDDNLTDRFINALKAGKLISRGDRVLAAVSGGADSNALLHLLVAARNTIGFDLFVGHLNHQLRGESADMDEQFVRRTAQELSLPFHAEAVDVDADRRQRGGSLEEAARRVRYEFYERAVRHFGAGRIALGHHRGDQVETVLFNIIRGTGLHGLRGMPRARPLRVGGSVMIVRPLLSITKDELVAYLQSKGLGWREDHTNAAMIASRNVLRHRVIPEMEQIHSGFAQHLLALADQAAEAEAIVDDRADRLLAVAQRDQSSWSIEDWRLDLSPAIVAGEAIRKMLIGVGVGAGRIAANHIADVLRLVRSNSGAVDLPDGIRARVLNDRLFVERKPAPQAKDLDAQIAWVGGECRFGDRRFSQQRQPFDRLWFERFLGEKTSGEEAIDAEKVEGNLVIRYAREGERFRPLGSPGGKKIGDFLTDRKVPPQDRPAVVVADARGVVWLVGFRIDQRVHVGERTRNVIVLRVESRPADSV